jgi:hypothetical protein
MGKNVFANWLRCEIVVNHNSYLTVANALRLVQERRSRALERGDEAVLKQLEIVDEGLRKYPSDISLLAVQIQEEGNHAPQSSG